MYPVFVVVTLPTRWGILLIPLEGNTHPPFWAWTKNPSSLVGIIDRLLGFLGVLHSMQPLSSCTDLIFLLRLWCWLTFLATSTTLEPSISVLHIHGARSVCVQLPLFSSSAQFSLKPLPAVHWFSARSWLLHQKLGTSVIPAEMAAFSLEVVLLAASGSINIRLTPSVSLCIPQPVLTQPMFCIIPPSSFSMVLVPPVFRLRLL